MDMQVQRQSPDLNRRIEHENRAESNDDLEDAPGQKWWVVVSQAP